MIRVNGKEQWLLKEVKVEELLEQLGYQITRVALELNGAMVPRKRLSEITVKDGDVLEIVSFVGGG
ncbi:sulfur carrier protein ThiS [Clostridium sp. E02]|uniref:sulfur carrier protein ThiS n=1 Tax=Clostridium sp. E02 TaxID=2487134 RepID=UPI000F520922|nr:sulfur carrier protein ThiS [Clostridium sp. E02]